MLPPNPAPHDSKFLRTLWWGPLAFVFLALLVLVATPVIVDRRVTALRNGPVYASDQARVLINDLQAAFAAQLMERDGQSLTPDSVARVARHITSDEVGLRSTVEELGGSSLARLDSLAQLLDRWTTTPHSTPLDAASVATARSIFDTAERLDDELATHADSARAAVRRLEQITLLSAAILVPISLLAMIAVATVGRRLRSLALTAEREQAEVTRAADARAALLRGVTHDVKNPLGAAAGYAELLNEGIVGPLSEPQREMVQRIHRLVGIAVATVTDLLELARADGGLQLEYATVDLGALARELVDDHRGMARECHLEIEVNAPSLPVVTDPVRVRQILANLVSNAIKYTPSPGRVTVSLLPETTHASQRRVGIAVRDSGPGVPPELRPHLFEEFFRVQNSAATVRGNGLGLAISRRLARLLNGDVTFEPASPNGSIFTLWLPATTSPARDS